MTSYPTLDSAEFPSELSGRTVLVRVDFNVPMQGDRVTDDTRLREALPTLRELLSKGAKVLAVSHRGRPKGERKLEFSLEPVAAALAGLLGQGVRFASDCVGDPVARAVTEMPSGELCLLENLRFHPGEESNDAEFASRLAEHADLYVNDAFGTAHRAHASTAGIVEHFEARAAGRLLSLELDQLGRLLDQPTPPFAAVTGGAKIKGKIATLRNLVSKVDRILVGGGMANTFLAARGLDLGSSLVEEEGLDLAREIESEAVRSETEIVLPSDLVVTVDLGASEPRSRVVPADGVEAGWLAVDIGPETCDTFARKIAGCGTLFWNGPMGVFEKAPFDRGSLEVGRAIGSCAGYTAVGGGETVAVAKAAGSAKAIDHISTGGGASLALLAGKELPAVKALSH